MSQSINWVFTINNPANNDLPSQWANVRYCIWQREEGENGTPHLQGYVVMKSKKSLRQMKELNATAHWETRKGKHHQAKAYASKEDTRKEGPWSFGEEPTQGKRSDLDEVFAMVAAGKTLSQIATEIPSTYVRYHKGITSLKFVVTKPRNFKTEVIVIWGETGVGKSKWAAETYGDEAYWKPPNSKWWDGYEGNNVAIVDEFYGWLSWTETLRLADRYPCSVETKGGSVQFVSKTLVFLSNQHPLEWYSNPRCQYPTLARRIDKLAKMRSDGTLDVEKGEF